MKEIQTGLYLEEHEFVIGGITHYNSTLSSANGYCFYDKTEEVFNEDGNIIPLEEIQPNQRKYSRWLKTPLTDIDEINAQYVSVPIEDGFEVV